jgi:ribose 5-phosphate isomerase A
MSEKLKKLAAEKAVEQIKSGMLLGLGSGSTAYFAIVKISELLKSGELTNIIGIPSSNQTQKLATDLGIPLTNFDAHPFLDLTIDGADEVDKYLNVIKGGGGALLREKVLAQSSRKLTIVVDESKISDKLGRNWAVPIEVIKFAVGSVSNFLTSIGGKPDLRKYSDGNPYLTDEGNYIIDTDFGVIENPFELADKLENRAGIIEHGLFIKLVDEVIVASEKEIFYLKK